MAQQTFGMHVQSFFRAPVRFFGKIRLDDAGIISLAKIVRTFDKRATSKSFEPFDALELAVIQTLVQVLCHHNETDLAPLDVPSVATIVERLMLSMPKSRAQEFRTLLTAIEYLPFKLGPKKVKFTELNLEEQILYLEKWDNTAYPTRHRRFIALKRIVMTAFWGEFS